MKYDLGVGLLAAVLLSTTALAQSAPADRSPSAASERTVSSHVAGQWRASKLAGVDVYNDQNDKIGDISDVILDSSGRATKVIVGVGGFLGMGERYVALDFDKVKWVNEPARSASTSTTTTGTGNRAATNVDSNARTASDGGTRTTTASARGNNEWYPDHAVYNASKDQLKAMPEFKY